MIKPLQKAVIMLGFSSGHPDAVSGPAGAGDKLAVRRAVKEALSAGLKELIFVTHDSGTPVEAQFGDIGSGKAERVVIARQFSATCLGEALCGIRHLLDEEPFVLLLPGDMQRDLAEEVTGALLAAYAEQGGNLVAVADESVLLRKGSFEAISVAPAGRYLLQSAVLDALEEDVEAGLANALLAVAEAWPVTALPPAARTARLTPLVPPSERPTVRGPRPVAAVSTAERGDWPGNAGL